VEPKLGPLSTSATQWPILPAPGDCDDGEIGAIKIVRGNWSTLRKTAPAPLCPPRSPLDQTRAGTRTAAVGSQRLTACAMSWPPQKTSFYRIVTCVLIARLRLGKYTPERANACNNRTSVARQRISKQTFQQYRDDIFRVVRVDG
jgi:hypothetical protein